MTLRFNIAAAAVALAASPAFAQTAWDMPTPYGDAVFHTQNITAFADDIREATDGALDITVHSAGSLFAHGQIKDSVRRGLAPIGEILMSQLVNENPVFGVDSIPFLAASYDEAEALWDASRDAVSEALEAQGLTLLFSVPWPGQSLFLREEVTEPAQLQGVTFRAYNNATERMAQLLGMIPTQVEAGDIPTAFSTGRVASMITSPSTGVSSQAWDYTSHYIDVQAWLPKNMVFVNSSALDALSDDERDAVLAAAEAAEARGWEMSRAETDTQIAALEEAGMVVMQPSDALSARLSEIGETMAAEWMDEAGDTGAAVLDAFRAE
ncbi:TRAP transporter substrate-binding protein [Roseinatronobacter monicus]|uniref:TRAP-type C4-dicarboxylate transport system substrate-binding protein n=1 Tax=Roseinatronobacter monicus TaxID=393481 RepID=A0A543KH39_9RHOB|nr:TRAP transporter substrate-binding protein [Roseinatronobacter monicus]TQM94337.1 TRAP-type C4-dicarboxylate transport system substrate-binding protein [Roseinatronobacter monicus]